jgi:hypothetical protein
VAFKELAEFLSDAAQISKVLITIVFWIDPLDGLQQADLAT